MADPRGEQLAITLFRALPADAVDGLVSRMGPTGSKLRTALGTAKTAPAPAELDDALTEFFDLYRIYDRGYLTAVPSGEYKPGQPPTSQTTEVPVELTPIDDPITTIKKFSADKLVRSLEGEPPSAVALILSCLEPTTAGAVLKGLPQDIRADIAMRFSQPGPRNFGLVTQLAKAVAEKGNTLVDQPVEAAPDDRIVDLAAMLRGLPRTERQALVTKMAGTDAELAERIKKKMFRFTDLLKVEDKPMQELLTQLGLKTIAGALKGADEKVSAKVLKNISSRSRELLSEEVEMLGNLSPTRIEEFQDEILAVLRQFEEEGKLTLDD